MMNDKSVAIRLEEPRFHLSYLLGKLTRQFSSVALVLFVAVQTINFGGGNNEGAELQGALRGTISADPFETRLVILRLLALTLTFVLLLRHATSHGRLRALI